MRCVERGIACRTDTHGQGADGHEFPSRGRVRIVRHQFHAERASAQVTAARLEGIAVGLGGMRAQGEGGGVAQGRMLCVLHVVACGVTQEATALHVEDILGRGRGGQTHSLARCLVGRQRQIATCIARAQAVEAIAQQGALHHGNELEIGRYDDVVVVVATIRAGVVGIIVVEREGATAAAQLCGPTDVAEQGERAPGVAWL